MIPNIKVLTDTITEVTHPTNTYKIHFSEVKQNPTNSNLSSFILGEDSLNKSQSRVSNVVTNDDRINGYVDGIDALIQAIYLILSTERYQFVIYSWDYGIELFDLIGQPMPYVMAELPRRIKDALTQDDRIEDVTDFEFEVMGKKLHTTFVVVSNLGNITTDLEVTI